MQLHVNQAVSAVGPTTLIAAPGAGLRITVLGLIVSNTPATAQTALLSFSAANQKLFQFGAAVGTVPSPELRWEGDVNAALTLTLAAATGVNVSIDYVIEKFV